MVDVDREKFFDRVNHDILIERLQTRIGDARVIRLIRVYLNGGIMKDGVFVSRHHPLSLLLGMYCWMKWIRAAYFRLSKTPRVGNALDE